MATLTRSIVIDAPVETVFDTALDISKLWKVKDVALADVTIAPEGVGTVSARLWTHLLGFHLEGGLRITEVVRPERIVAQVDFFAEKPTWRFTFAGVDGGTEIDCAGGVGVAAPGARRLRGEDDGQGARALPRGDARELQGGGGVAQERRVRRPGRATGAGAAP